MARHHSLAQFELLVLAAVVRLGEEAYAVNVRREILRRCDREVAMGAVYATLGRLEDKGLLGHSAARTLAPRGGLARKKFYLTPTGRSLLIQAAQMMDRMLEGIVPLAEGA